MRIYGAIFVVMIPSMVFAQAIDPSVIDILPKPVVTALALIPIVQAVARLFAEAGKVINGKTSGRGSGWYKFWNVVARFPGKNTSSEDSGSFGG